MCDVGLVASSRIWFGWLLHRNQYLRFFRFSARKMAQDPQTTHGSTAYGVHRTKPNVSEDLLMDLKCQDLRESWNNERIPERLPISRSLRDTYTNSKLSHISAFCVVEGQLHLCQQMQEGPLRVLDLVSMIEFRCIASFSVNRFGVISTAKWNRARLVGYLLESIVDG